MSTVSVPFQDLAARIQQQEADLAQLRQELESRRSQLSELTRRKEELQVELAKVEKDIEAVGQATILEPAVSTAGVAKPGSSKAASKPTVGVSLPTYLIQMVGQAKKPITVKALAEEVMRNKFPTTSKNVPGMVQTRVYDLVKKGLLRRASDSSGFVLAQTSLSSNSVATKFAAGAPKIGKAKVVSAKPPSSTRPAKWRSLHEVLTHVLAKSSRPLTAQELADGVTQSGYESKSKDLKNVIWVSIGKLANVERLPGQGYQLKKGKVSGAKRKV
jgi:uncharacterized protein YhaN